MAKSRNGRLDITKTLRDLVSFIREIVDITKAFEDVPGLRLSKEESSKLDILKRGVAKQAIIVQKGEELDEVRLRKTWCLAQAVLDRLESHFDEFMTSCFSEFDALMAKIREKSPEWLEQEGDTIANLQDKLRKAIGDEQSSYVMIVEAYTAVHRHLISINREVVEAEQRDRAEKRRQKQREVHVALASDLLKELEELAA